MDKHKEVDEAIIETLFYLKELAAQKGVEITFSVGVDKNIDGHHISEYSIEHKVPVNANYYSPMDISLDKVFGLSTKNPPN